MLAKVLLLVISTSQMMVNWPFAVGQLFEVGDVHLEEKSCWYECMPREDGEEGKTCNFKQCIMKYNQTTDGPVECMTPRALYDFHKAKGTLDDLKKRNCYEIRKIYSAQYEEAVKTPCVAVSDVDASKTDDKKSVCNLKGDKKVTHKYDYGFYECKNNDDFELQGCKFEDKQCGTYNDIQDQVNVQKQLKDIVNGIKTQRERDETPRTECYEFRNNKHLQPTKKPCYNQYELEEVDFETIVDNFENEEKTSSTTTTTEKPTTTTTSKYVIIDRAGTPDYDPNEDD